MISDLKRQVISLYAEGLELYRRGESYLPEAQARFEQALELDPGDGPSRTLVERCRKYIENGAPPGYEIHKMESK